MKHHGLGRVAVWTDLAGLLDEAAVSIAARMQRSTSRRPRTPRGGTLRPGIDSPLWLALVQSVRPHLQGRGQKALLARELGVHRARIGEYFVRGTAMPDAERTLLILTWLARRPAKGTK